MVGKLNLDLGEDYAFDIRRAKEVAENAAASSYVDEAGPFKSLSGAQYWLRGWTLTTEWDVGFDVFKPIGPESWVPIQKLLENDEIEYNDRQLVAMKARKLGWEG